MQWKLHVQFLEGENLVRERPISTDPSSFTAFSYKNLYLIYFFIFWIKLLLFIIKVEYMNINLLIWYIYMIGIFYKKNYSKKIYILVINKIINNIIYIYLKFIL